MKHKHKNMKIEINAEQPLEEVVAELERLGYSEHFRHIDPWQHILVMARGTFQFVPARYFGGFPLTTISELKGMR